MFGLILSFYSCSDPNSTKDSKVKVEDENSIQESSSLQKSKTKNILFFGNSLTAAYGLDPSDGFTALIQNRLDSLGYRYKVINAGLSGETTAGGNERVNWVLRQPVDIFVLELGGNDGLRGIDPQASYQNLQSIINKVKEKYPKAKIILAGMEAPPNMGQAFTKEFRDMYPKLAAENGIALIPFLLKDVGGIPKLNLRDGIHPNKAGQKIVMETVWETLEKVL